MSGAPQSTMVDRVFRWCLPLPLALPVSVSSACAEAHYDAHTTHFPVRPCTSGDMSAPAPADVLRTSLSPTFVLSRTLHWADFNIQSWPKAEWRLPGERIREADTALAAAFDAKADIRNTSTHDF